MTANLTFTLNGKPVATTYADDESLLSVLRERLGEIPRRRMARHGEEPELHANCSLGGRRASRDPVWPAILRSGRARG